MNKKAFTLMEMIVVMTIILILAATIIPIGHQMIQMGKGRRFIQDCEMFIQAAEKYRLDNGSYPADITAGGSIPSALRRYIPRGFEFDEPTPIGGQWIWQDLTGVDGFTQGHGIEARSSGTYPLQVDSTVLGKLDTEFDNGDASSGQHRYSGTTYYRVCTPNAR